MLKEKKIAFQFVLCTECYDIIKLKLNNDLALNNNLFCS